MNQDTLDAIIAISVILWVVDCMYVLLFSNRYVCKMSHWTLWEFVIAIPVLPVYFALMTWIWLIKKVDGLNPVGKFKDFFNRPLHSFYRRSKPWRKRKGKQLESWQGHE